MKTLTINVYGMACGGCSGRVERGLAELAGVEKVEASHDADQTTLFYDADAVDPALLNDVVAEKIKAMGFSLQAE